MQLVRRYFEELLVPSKEVDWRLIGFEVSPEDPDDPLPPRCEQCSKHVLDINALDENFSTKITDLHHEEGVADVQNKRMRKIGRRSPEELQRDSYSDLISHIVVLANMDLTPHSHAVGKVMKQLSGTTKQVLGPASYTANNEFVHSRKIIWNRQQQKLFSSLFKKVVLQSDFGCGKSFLLHRMIQRCHESELEPNLLLSFLLQERPFVRGVIDVANRMLYRGQGQKVKVISVGWYY